MKNDSSYALSKDFSNQLISCFLLNVHVKTLIKQKAMQDKLWKTLRDIKLKKRKNSSFWLYTDFICTSDFFHPLANKFR